MKDLCERRVHRFWDGNGPLANPARCLDCGDGESRGEQKYRHMCEWTEDSHGISRCPCGSFKPPRPPVRDEL